METDHIIQSRMNTSPDKIAAFCKRWQVTELALFGSVLRDDFSPESDIDVLVRFTPEAGYSLMDFVGMQDELSGMLGRQVDLVILKEWKAVENSRNYIRREDVLGSAETIYAA